MSTAMTPPGLTHLMPACLAFGLAQNRTARNTDTRMSSTGHLTMFHTRTAVSPAPMSVADLLGHRTAHDDDDDADDDDDHRQHGQADPDRHGLPDRPALADVVDDVGRAHEGGDVPGRRPQGDEDPDDRADPGAGPVALRLADEVRHQLGARARSDAWTWLVTCVVVSRTEQSEDGDEDDERRYRRQRRVVGEPGREVGEVVAAELLAGAADVPAGSTRAGRSGSPGCRRPGR